jgi:hypothetical protein
MVSASKLSWEPSSQIESLREVAGSAQKGMTHTGVRDIDAASHFTPFEFGG